MLAGDAGAAATLVLAHVQLHAPIEGGSLTVDQAAKVLAISPRTVRELCEAGSLRHHRVGKKGGVIRLRAEDVEAYRESAERAVFAGEITAMDRHQRRK